MDYALEALGSREFEHLTQALCHSALGARVEVFGDGPDGGREATVDGRISWNADDALGDPAEVWDGYTVVQAKYRLRPKDPENNLTWLLNELRKELGHWTDPLRRRARQRKPDYLLIVTNVVLSPGTDAGIDTAKAEIAKLVKDQSLTLKGWRLWHYDSFRTLLDAHREVRVTYDGFLRTGDVLARIDDILGRSAPDVGAALTLHAAKDMLAARHLRLGQAGTSTNDTFSLADVGIDLNVETSPSNETAHVGPALRYVIDRSDRVKDHGLPQDAPRHLLLVGGPGQGKSTLSQLLCHSYRVALLRDTPLSTDAARLRDDLAAHFDTIGLPIPRHRRWPIRVVLSEYGDYLAENPESSLLRFLAERIRVRSVHDITAADLVSWLRAWPWLLVLDGMDEVVAPLTRAAVAKGVSEFLEDVAHYDADVLVVATTRPQGYVGEFGAENYQRLALKPLDPQDALRYAELLTQARLHDDDDLRLKVNTRIADAADAPETARLMRTPLQVTIMTLLLERRERVPHDRYQLFDAYFQTIYAREANKPTELGRLLEERRPDIEAIHKAVALDLQEQAEAPGSSDAWLPAADLKRHIRDRLAAEGHEPAAADRLVSQMTAATTDRLVLLVPHGEGVGFEVRSLQEYLAAQALTDGETNDTLARLTPLIPSAHWRNTWLFAAGRIFREREGLRGPLISALRDVDNANLFSLIVHSGAELATELLADNIALHSPQFRRQLADLAIERIHDLPDHGSGLLATALARFADDDVIRQKTDERINAALAAGGGARAQAITLLDGFADGVGGLAARARQQRAALGSRRHPANHAFTLTSEEAAAGLSPGPPPIDYLAPHLAQDLPTSVRDGILEMLGSAFDQSAWLGDPESASKILVRAGKRTALEPAVVDAVLHDPIAAEGLARLITNIPNEAWRLAGTLRDIAKSWHAHRPRTYSMS